MNNIILIKWMLLPLLIIYLHYKYYNYLYMMAKKKYPEVFK